MSVIVNELEVMVEAPSPEDGPVPAEQAAPGAMGKPAPRVLRVQDLTQVRRHQDERDSRLRAE